MSLQSLILSLISDIDDPAVRMDVASTIVFLKDLYLSGAMGAEQLKSELKEVALTVIDALHPELLPEEREKKAEEMASQMARAIKLETLRARAFSKHRPRFPFPPG